MFEPVAQRAGMARTDPHLAVRLQGRPAPETFPAGARALGTKPGEAAAFEDAPAGVAAGRGSGFACVARVDRAARVDARRERDADVVVSGLAEPLDET
jgi:beta-phosphoglucomutase-like phosphatase (HAD superfamily)